MTKKDYKEIGTEDTEKLTKSRTFETRDDGRTEPKNAKLFIFRWEGDALEGQLIAGPIVNFRRNSSYKLKTEDGKIVEFFGNKQLHKIIKDNELLGSCIKVEYIGHMRVPNCARARKVYRVWKVSGVASRIESEQTPGKKV